MFSSTSAAAPASSAPAPTEALRFRRTPVVDVFEACRGAVVNISSTQVIEVRSHMGLMEDFFDLPRPARTYRTTSVGSGFVLHPAGYIVTNAHVVARTAERKVIFPDQREVDAQIVAIDHARDLAVLKIEAPQPLPTLRLGRSDDLMVGETVIAIGNPLGYQHTVTAGVVSATDRTLEVSRDVAFHGLIQTDASINPGNSGGPLLNVLGELIGVNTAIRGDAQNIGFAIPVDQLRAVLPAMLDVERRYRIETGIKLDEDGSARIAEVAPESPAAKAKLRAGQRIVALGEQRVGSAIDYCIALIDRKAGDRLRVVCEVEAGEGGSAKRTEAWLTLAERPKPDGAALLAARFGLAAEPVSARFAESLGLPRLRGLVVSKVEPDSPAAALGLQPGDIIDQIGGYQVAGPDDVGELLEEIQPGAELPVSVLRISGRYISRAQAVITAR